MHHHPNMLCSGIAKDKVFTDEMAQAIEKLFNSSNTSFVKNKFLDSKIIIEKKNAYLIVSKNGGYSVYYTKMYNDEPFNHLKDSLNKNSEIYEDILYASKTNSGQAISSKVKSLLAKVVATPDEIAQVFGKELNDDIKTTYSPYRLKMFLHFLTQKGFLSNVIDDKYLEDKSSAVAQFIDYKEELLISTDFLISMATKHKIFSKNKFKFNDSDNHMWQQHNGLVIDDQNCNFYIIKENNNYTYYAWDKQNDGDKKNKTLKALVADIEQNSESLIDNVILKIVDNKIVFVDNAFIYSLSFDIQHTKLAFLEEYKENVEYPVDIQSYEYQLAYHKKHYGMTEFQFVASAVLSYSTYEYDKNKKSFYNNNITYKPDVIDTVFDIENEKQKTFSYCILPKKFNYELNDKWQAGIIHMVNILKNDRPIPKVSNNADKAKDVEDVIEFFEKVISKFEKKNKKIKP